MTKGGELTISPAATTNPSLVYTAAQDPKYEHLVKAAVAYAKQKGGSKHEQVEAAVDKLFVDFGIEILKARRVLRAARMLTL